jgi:hypothetical protein
VFEEHFLNEVFAAPRCAQDLFDSGDGISQTTHCPVKMMKLELFGSGDEIILSQTLDRPIVTLYEIRRLASRCPSRESRLLVQFSIALKEEIIAL